jgi:hypothetical protein
MNVHTSGVSRAFKLKEHLGITGSKKSKFVQSMYMAKSELFARFFLPVKIFDSLQDMFQSIYSHRAMVNDVICPIRDLGQFPWKRHT